MDQRPPPAATGAKALGQHADDRDKIFAPQRPVWPGTTHQREELVLLPLPRRDLGDDLLRQHIERLFGDREAIELAAIDTIQQGRALDELVTRQREEPALWGAVDRVARAADALQEGRD